MFRASGQRRFLDRPGLEILWLSASSAVTTGHDAAVLPRETSWETVLEFEEAACTEPGYLDAGTHLIAGAKRAV